MELGNAVFGHSRGEYPIDRKKFQDLFCGYLERMGFDGYGLPENGKQNLEPFMDGNRKFDNGTFSLFAYWWGDCECGFEQAEERWSIDHAGHYVNCYQQALTKLLEAMPKGMSREAHDASVLKLCRRFGLTFGGWGVHCTCKRAEEWAQFLKENRHLDSCPLVWPNFHHKKSGLKIMWYKYPLRDSYSNQRLTAKLLTEVMEDCLKSLSRK
jgi:hypothetical protein